MVLNVHKRRDPDPPFPHLVVVPLLVDSLAGHDDVLPRGHLAVLHPRHHNLTRNISIKTAGQLGFSFSHTVYVLNYILNGQLA